MKIPQDLTTNDKYSLKDKILGIDYFLKRLDKELIVDYRNLPHIVRQNNALLEEYRSMHRIRTGLNRKMKAIEDEMGIKVIKGEQEALEGQNLLIKGLYEVSR